MGPQFSNQDSRLGPVNEKAKKLSTLHHPRSISVTSAILNCKVQPCPTSSGVVVPTVPLAHEAVRLIIDSD